MHIHCAVIFNYKSICMKILFVVLLAVASFTSLACLNEHHVNRNGKSGGHYFTMESSRFYKQHYRTQLEARLQELKKRKYPDKEDIFQNENSIAVVLIKLGQLEEAETILNKLHKEQPNDYTVIANLGTLYELQGKNEKALEYIRRSIAINPRSHGGSEWFHVSILEFKLKNIKDSDIPNTDILHLANRPKEAGFLAGDIKYQLQERIPFTPAPNLMMAKVLDEYASWLAEKVSIKMAYLMYDMATNYDTANILHVKESREALKPLLKKHKASLPDKASHYFDPNTPAKKAASPARATKTKKETSSAAWIIGAVAVAGAGGAWFYRRGKRGGV